MLMLIAACYSSPRQDFGGCIFLFIFYVCGGVGFVRPNYGAPRCELMMLSVLLMR